MPIRASHVAKLLTGGQPVGLGDVEIIGSSGSPYSGELLLIVQSKDFSSQPQWWKLPYFRLNLCSVFEQTAREWLT